MNRIRVLIVDDSAYNRQVIGNLLSELEGVQVVGKASAGDEALVMVEQLRPDLVTLDLEMPRMDGYTFLRILMSRRPTPVLVVSGYAEKDNVFRALELGALDFVPKPSVAPGEPLDELRAILLEKVRLVRHLAMMRSGPRVRDRSHSPFQPSAPPPQSEAGAASRVILIGASTGGPSALVELFSSLRTRTSDALVVLQHMPAKFTRTFAERLNRASGFLVKEAESLHRLCEGEAWVCPGGKCIEFTHNRRLRVRDPLARERYVPSITSAFESAAARFGSDCVGIILTGMGDDGATGISAIREVGGGTIAQTPDTALIPGMPSSAIDSGHVDQVMTIPQLARYIQMS